MYIYHTLYYLRQFHLIIDDVSNVLLNDKAQNRSVVHALGPPLQIAFKVVWHVLQISGDISKED